MQPPTNNIYPKKRFTLLSSLFFTALAVLVIGVAFTKQRAIADYVALRGYQPPAAIAQLATQDTLTSSARRIFYVNRPSVNDREPFLKACPNSSREQTIVLGCYQSDQSGIFLLNVSDPRLDGVKQVTAAHELLHAAYDRLSSSERQAIDKQLLAFYHSQLQDERIKTTIDAYRQSEPKDVVNEMHSIFGTEVAQLPPSLEQYYKQYFTDRAAVIAFSNRYQAEFTSRKAKVAAYDAQLKQLKSQIEADEADLKAKQGSIAAQQASLTQLRNSSNYAAYNAGVPEYNAAIGNYNGEVEAVRTLILTYNQTVNARNAIADEEDQLVQSLSAQNQAINN